MYRARQLPYVDSMRVAKAVLLAVLLTGTACEMPFAPQNAAPFAPPAIFSSWWAEIERCSGRTGHWTRIRWFVVPTDELVLEGRPKYGVWSDPHTVYLATVVVQPTDGKPPWQPWTQRVVQHEMLHDLTGPEHGAVFDRCGVR